jgi:hypothetical protein
MEVDKGGSGCSTGEISCEQQSQALDSANGRAFFQDENWTDRLSRNVDNSLPINAAQHPRKAQTKFGCGVSLK